MGAFKIKAYISGDAAYSLPINYMQRMVKAKRVWEPHRIELLWKLLNGGKVIT